MASRVLVPAVVMLLALHGEPAGDGIEGLVVRELVELLVVVVVDFEVKDKGGDAALGKRALLPRLETEMHYFAFACRFTVEFQGPAIDREMHLDVGRVVRLNRRGGSVKCCLRHVCRASVDGGDCRDFHRALEDVLSVGGLVMVALGVIVLDSGVMLGSVVVDTEEARGYALLYNGAVFSCVALNTEGVLNSTM